MTEIAPHIDFDFQERAKRLENRSAEEELSDTMNGAMNTIISGVYTYARRKAEEAKQWESAYHAVKDQNEYLLKLLEQNGIPTPDFSKGIPPSVPSQTKKNTKAKEKNFKELIQIEDKEKLLKRLHNLIDGHGGKDVALVLLKALKEKFISHFPSEKVFKTEFKNITTGWRSISYYLNPNCNPTPDYSAIVI